MKIFTFFVKLILLLFYFLSYIIPRKKNRWLFGEPHGFNNNSKYLFLDVLENHKDIEAIWIGDKKTVKYLQSLNLPSYYKYSLKGLYYCLTSRIYVVSWLAGDINFYTSGGAKIVNLWHGIGWKKCLWMEPQNVAFHKSSLLKKLYHIITKPALHFKPAIVLSSSPFYTENVFTKAFEVKPTVCVEAMYPRCEPFIEGKENVINYIERFSLSEEKRIIEDLKPYNKVYIYAPTFRDDNSDFIKSSGIDFEDLDKRFQKLNYILLIKLHPRTNICKDRFASYSNIHLLPNILDLNPIMAFSDGMISDYSSVWVDYLLLNKPLLIFAFDFEQFVKNCRGMIFDFEKAIEGLPVAQNYTTLINYLIDGIPSCPLKTIELYWKPSKNLISEIKVI